MKLAKTAIDLGLYTERRAEQLSFWQDTALLPFDSTLKLGGGVHQLRHDLKGSVLKLNHSRFELPANTASAICELLIADDHRVGESLIDADNNRLSFVSQGQFDISHIGIKLHVKNLEESLKFYIDVMGFEQLADNRIRLGSSVLILEENLDFNRPDPSTMAGLGFRYLTIQIWDVDQEHADIISRGGVEAAAPITLGSTARISFVLDPDNTWIELSQRASLTGDLS